jgi:KDO2-lipid IV(A) lauroyltransferase
LDPRQSTFRKIRYAFEYLLFRVLRATLRGFSAKRVFRLGKLLGTLAYQFVGKRSHIAQTNLDIAFGDSKTREEKDRIIKESWIQIAVSTVQCLWLSHQTRERVKELVPTTPEGLDEVKKCLEPGKGIFFLTAHYGNWEVMGLNHGYLGVCQLHSIARKFDNPKLEEFIMNLRTISGNGIFHREESPLKMVRAVKRNESVAVMMDQNGGDFALFLDFFGVKASTPRSLALLSYSTGAPIVPMFNYPQGDGTYKVKYGPALCLEKTGNKDEDVPRWTQECLHYLENVIREKPEPWMWIHRRWKSRPPEERDRPIYK